MADASTPHAYFRRLSDQRFEATAHVGGAWATTEQHVSPALGLLAHAIEVDRDTRRDDQLPLARLSYDIFGAIPIDVVDIEVEVVRPGRTIELVEARLRYAGRVAVALRAWLMRPYETSEFAATPLERIEPPDRMVPWDPSTFWPGGFVSSVEVRRAQQEPGRAAFWLRTGVALVEGEAVSDLARAAGLFDMANGMTPARAVLAARLPERRPHRAPLRVPPGRVARVRHRGHLRRPRDRTHHQYHPRSARTHRHHRPMPHGSTSELSVVVGAVSRSITVAFPRAMWNPQCSSRSRRTSTKNAADLG